MEEEEEEGEEESGGTIQASFPRSGGPGTAAK